MLSSGGDDNPKAPLKVFWGIVMGATAGILLIMGGGGLNALQMASIVGAFPFMFIMFAICYSIMKFVKEDAASELETTEPVELTNSQNNSLPL
jgi:glycine betaine transporter